MLSPHVWTIAEAKARLSEILRLASREGPQRIGTHKRYVLVPEEVWERLTTSGPRLGPWLVDNMPRADGPDDELQPPDRRDPPRDSPFEPGGGDPNAQFGHGGRV
jgi:prevent-host-death family protein